MQYKLQLLDLQIESGKGAMWILSSQDALKIALENHYINGRLILLQ